MATQPCHTANGYWGLDQYLHGYSALSPYKWALGKGSISSWLLSPVTLQMGTGDCVNIFMAAQPCHTANGNWGLRQYLYGCSALSHCQWVLGIASMSLWLLSPVTLQMGTGDCVYIFMDSQPCNTVNGYWGLHQYLYGYSALSHCKWVLGIASISSWLLRPVTLQMGTGDCVNIFMASQPCHIAHGHWGLDQYLYGYSALSHCRWVLAIAPISLWLLSTLHSAHCTGDCTDIFMATQHTGLGTLYWRLQIYFTAAGPLVLSHKYGQKRVHLGVQK